MNRLRSVGTVCLFLVGLLSPRAANIWASEQSPNTLPLPLVRRTQPVGPDVFSKAAVMLVVRIRERCEVEAGGFEGQSLNPIRTWTYTKARVLQIVHINERQEGDPDLAEGEFLLEQMQREKNPLRLEFGKRYLLLLTPSREFILTAETPNRRRDWYVLAVPQGGFEIAEGKLVPLVRGGELDAYDGRLVEDVIKEIQTKK